MVRGLIDNALMVRKNFELMAARDSNESDAAAFGEPYPGRCRRRHGGDNRSPEPRRLLDELYRDPAGQKYEAMRGPDTAPCERANEFVERIVPADVLPHGDKTARWSPKARGVNGMGCPIQLLLG